MSKTDIVVKQCSSNGETFEIGSYHGIEILIRKSDKYVNATKLCSQFGTRIGNGKQFRKLLDNSSWKEFYHEFSLEYEKNVFAGKAANRNLIDDCMNSYAVQLRGYYIHPELINYVTISASPKYAVYV